MRIIKPLILGIMMFVLLACNDDDDNTSTCNTDSPLEEISWLKEIRDGFDTNTGNQKHMIIQYRYNGEDVFLIHDCYLCPDALSFVYDCEKNVLCEFGGIDGRNTCPDFDQNATNKIILFDN